MECKICNGELEIKDEKYICKECGYMPDPNTADIGLKISPQELKSKFDAHEKVFLLDVRPQEEHDFAKINGSFLMPLNELPLKYETLSRERLIIVYCHHGMRSLNAARFLMQKGFKNVRSLEGGIHLWSSLVDNSIPKY